MEKQREFITKFAEWSRMQNHILGLALVGSYATGLERPDSDVDFVIISDDANGLLQNDHWIQLFGRVSKTQLEDYGLVQSLRVFYEDGVEAEFGLTSREWLRTDPIDADTRPSTQWRRRCKRHQCRSRLRGYFSARPTSC
jgi:hypothetical protein